MLISTNACVVTSLFLWLSLYRCLLCYISTMSSPRLVAQRAPKTSKHSDCLPNDWSNALSDSIVDHNIAHDAPVHPSNLEAKPLSRHIDNVAHDARTVRRTAVKTELFHPVDSVSSPPIQPRPHMSLQTCMDIVRTSGPPDTNSILLMVLLSFLECLLMLPQGSLLHPQRLVVALPLRHLPLSGSLQASPCRMSRFRIAPPRMH